MTDSSSFHRLSHGVQRWIYRQGWSSLRGIQEAATPLILEGETDVLITAPTAGGKTEAAFLPLISWLEEHGPGNGYGVLCLSPLKALINDQFERLELLCESANTAITPWHGDVSASVKQRSWKRPTGVLMITPESLEAMFVTRAHELKDRLASLQYVVIDEFHAFLDRERGQQLLSLLSRLDTMLGRQPCRIALSATIGDPDMALKSLRPGQSRPSLHLEVPNESMDLRLKLKAYPVPGKGHPTQTDSMAADLFNDLRGKSHLVFANNRRTVEEITDRLSKLCDAQGVPLEFFAHHGSLSKDVRHYVEQRLKRQEKPTTGIATSTLELGIDIGDVTSVGQVGAPANVSSIRQRLGRSGRREGAPAILRILVAGHGDSAQPDPVDRIEAELFQAVAVIELMLERWIEPPDQRSLHLSTMVQQILSMIAFQGGITAAHAYKTLCKSGPWRNVSPELFGRVLKGLGANNVISQLPTGELIVGVVGEKLVSHYTFYTAFEVPEEFRLLHNGKALGTLPMTTPYVPGQLLLFGGRRWSVTDVNLDSKTITLGPAKNGMAPKFGGEPAPVHRAVRQRMLELYLRDDIPRYCDDDAARLITQARTYFRQREIQTNPIVRVGETLYWFIWEDERLLDTIKVIASVCGYPADKMGPCVLIEYQGDPDDLTSEIISYLRVHDEADLAQIIEPVPLGKFDDLLPDDLLQEAFVAEKIDLAGARQLFDCPG